MKPAAADGDDPATRDVQPSMGERASPGSVTDHLGAVRVDSGRAVTGQAVHSSSSSGHHTQQPVSPVAGAGTLQGPAGELRATPGNRDVFDDLGSIRVSKL